MEEGEEDGSQALDVDELESELAACSARSKKLKAELKAAETLAMKAKRELDSLDKLRIQFEKQQRVICAKTRNEVSDSPI